MFSKVYKTNRIPGKGKGTINFGYTDSDIRIENPVDMSFGN